MVHSWLHSHKQNLFFPSIRLDYNLHIWEKKNFCKFIAEVNEHQLLLRLEYWVAYHAPLWILLYHLAFLVPVEFVCQLIPIACQDLHQIAELGKVYHGHCGSEPKTVSSLGLGPNFFLFHSDCLQPNNKQSNTFTVRFDLKFSTRRRS